MTALAKAKPRGGESGKVVDNAWSRNPSEKKVDTFRGGLSPAISSQDVWPLFLVIMGCVFFADVLVRRVTVSFSWLPPLVNRLRARLFGRQAEEQPEERIARLRTSKAAIAEEIDERRAATRFEPVLPETSSATSADELLRQASGGAPTTGPVRDKAPANQLTPDSPDAESYTSRLLKAKQQAKREGEGRSGG
jgi:hypothetical protein